MCLLVFIQIIVALTRLDTTSQLGFFIVNILLLVYVFLGMGFVGVLLGFHTYLAANNTTTN
jgi:L-cystine uptake protein TcyP (sodium:dicarboxylate symporter family)